MRYIATIISAAALSALCACTDADPAVDFGVDQDTFRMEAVGGVCPIRVSSDTEWIASSDDPWITITPANGRGSTECRILVDSALTDTPRQGLVVIEQQNADKTRRRINIEQSGFEYAITLGDENRNVEIDNYSDYESRYFDLTVTTNVDFDVEIPDTDQNWLSVAETYKVNLNRGIRPREVKLRFKWGINSIPERRISDIRFRPKGVDESMIVRNDILNVVQKAAERIEENTRQGDSVALLGIQRALGVWSGAWDASTPMDEWRGVTLWHDYDDRPEGVEPGRVRRASFYLFETKDSVLPYEIQYLTAVEELDFFSNVNSFLYSFTDTGEYLPKLSKNLKRLFLEAMGYTDLPESFGELHNLEHLSLMFNNFQKIPDVINGKNFPKLHALYMNGNRRHEIDDLSTTIYENYGGLVEEGRNGSDHVLTRLFREFPQMDTLVIGINYLHGQLPTFEGPEYDNEQYRWTGHEFDGLKPSFTDSLPQSLIDGVEIDGTHRKIPKVMPQLNWFTLIGNRFTGMLPPWMLYHPRLDNWIPQQLIFNQEGRTLEGERAGFDNEPVNMEYYYDFYEGYKKRPADDTFDSEDATVKVFDYEGPARLKAKKGLLPDGTPIKQ